MKNIKDIISESTINEARQIEYRVSLIECVDRENLPITVTVLVDKEDQKWFESYLEDQEGNLFMHAEGGNVEY